MQRLLLTLVWINQKKSIHMKNLYKLYSVTFALILTMFLVSCEGPAGPMGPAGKDGADGTDANQTCKLCHNPSSVDLISVQYQFSKHHYGEAAFEEAGNFACSPCHTQEAFKYVCANNVPATFSFNNTTGKYTNNYVTSTSTAYGELGCATCHSSLHQTYTTEDGALTTVAPVDLNMWGGAKTVNLTADGGKSNLCVKCHQPRPLTNGRTNANVLNYDSLAQYPKIVFFEKGNSAARNVLNPGYRTHIHYGAVGAVFAGTGGVEFSGSSSYANSYHTANVSCQQCHMAPMYARSGEHTFFAKGNFNGCITCHPGVSANDANYWKEPRAEIKALLEELGSKLVVNGKEIMNTNADTEANLWASLTSKKYDGYLDIYDPTLNPDAQLQNPVSGSAWTQAQKDHNATLEPVVLTNAQMGAIINFQLCLRDYSLGIHNFKYSKALLKNSIEAIN
jgi:hypothetical protein